MITLIALSRLTSMEPSNQKERKNHESNDSVQKNTNRTTSHRTCARCVDSRAGPRNGLVRSYNRRPFIRSEPSAGRFLPGWLARLDVQGHHGLEPQDKGEGRFGPLGHRTHLPAWGTDWVAHPPWP